MDQSKETLAGITQAAALISQARQAVVLTGAGSSTPSGIPDFRSTGSGLWTRYLPMEVASLTTFRQQPELFFEWLRPLASFMLSAQPNAAHIAIATMQNKGYVQTVITQNIDTLLQRAGAKGVLEVHGTFETLTCIQCYKQYKSNGFLEPYLERGVIPRCLDCGSILKPDVVLFEEQLPARIWLKARQAASHCDLMLVAGTSLSVMPVAQLPQLAKGQGARLIILNQSPTYLDEEADVLLNGDVAEILPAIAAEVCDD